MAYVTDNEFQYLGSLSIVGVNPKKQNKRTRQAMAEKAVACLR